MSIRYAEVASMSARCGPNRKIDVSRLVTAVELPAA